VKSGSKVQSQVELVVNSGEVKPVFRDVVTLPLNSYVECSSAVSLKDEIEVRVVKDYEIINNGFHIPLEDNILQIGVKDHDRYCGSCTFLVTNSDISLEYPDCRCRQVRNVPPLSSRGMDAIVSVDELQKYSMGYVATLIEAIENYNYSALIVVPRALKAEEIDIEHIIKDFSYSWSRESIDDKFHYVRRDWHELGAAGYIDRDFCHRRRRAHEMDFNLDVREANPGAKVVVTEEGDASLGDSSEYIETMGEFRQKTTRVALVVVDQSGNYYVGERFSHDHVSVQTFVSCEILGRASSPEVSLARVCGLQYDVPDVRRLRYFGILDLNLLKDKYYIYLKEYEQLPYDMQRHLKLLNLDAEIDIELVMTYRMMVMAKLDNCYLKEPAGYCIKKKDGNQVVMQHSYSGCLTKLGPIGFHISSSIAKCVSPLALDLTSVVKIVRPGAKQNVVIQVQDKNRNSYLGFFAGYTRTGEQFGFEYSVSPMYVLLKAVCKADLDLSPGLVSEFRPYNNLFRTNWKEDPGIAGAHQDPADWTCDKETGKGEAKNDLFLNFHLDYCLAGSYGLDDYTQYEEVVSQDVLEGYYEDWRDLQLDDDGYPIDEDDF